MARLDPAALAQLWIKWYPEVAPFGYALRWAYPDRWLRIHSLPLSKRWPETPSEREEVLARHNAVATALLGAGTRCLLIGYEYDGAAAFAAEHGGSSLLGTPLEFMFSIAGDDQESPPTSVFGTTVEWLPGRFDPLVLAIADDRLRALWMAADSGVVFAPYDGGADLIYATEWQRDVAREQFKDWLSDHPEGL